VVTSQDLAIAAAPAVTLAATSTTGQFTVTVNPNTPAATGVTYMTGPFSASTAFAAGSQIEIEAPTGTTFPSVPSDYELYDLSTPSSTQQPSAVAIDGTANDMILTLASPLNAGDNLKLVVNDVTNPPAGVYTLSLGAVTTGDALSLFTTLPATPNAGVTYPNGAIVRNPNGAEYIFAGGKAFPITSPAVGHAIYEADHGHVPSVVQLSSALPASVITGPARPGTLLQVAGKAPIYVVGTNGTSVYSFTSPSNFLGDGYDPNNVVEISALTTSTTGGCCTYTPGTAPTAAQTMADGALLRTKAGGVYLVEGGTAFPVTNGSLLKTIQKVDPAQVLQNITITATNTNQPTANGTLLQQIGTKGVYVSYQGVLYPLPSPKELTSDGYTFQMVVMVPSLGPNPTAPAGVS